MNDRGNIKWTSLMLPEHVDMLKRLWAEDEYATRPQLDEQELERINQMVLIAAKKKQPVIVTFFQDGRKYCYQGVIHAINAHQQSVTLEQIEQLTTTITIHLHDIIDVQVK